MAYNQALLQGNTVKEVKKEVEFQGLLGLNSTYGNIYQTKVIIKTIITK